jgi:hypothetical protein
MTTYAQTALKWTTEDGEKHRLDEGEKVPSLPKEIKETFEAAGALGDAPPLKGDRTVQDILEVKEMEIEDLKRQLKEAKEREKNDDGGPLGPTPPFDSGPAAIKAEESGQAPNDPKTTPKK